MDFIFLSVTSIFFAAVLVLLVLNIAGVFVSTVALSVVASIAAAMLFFTLALFLYKGAESCSDCINHCAEKRKNKENTIGKRVLSDSYIQSMFPEERVNVREAVNKKSNESFSRAMSISPIRHKQKPIRANRYESWKKDFIRKERVIDDHEKERFIGPGKGIV
jgi:hypothetical protein